MKNNNNIKTPIKTTIDQVNEIAENGLEQCTTIKELTDEELEAYAENRRIKWYKYYSVGPDGNISIEATNKEEFIKLVGEGFRKEIDEHDKEFGKKEHYSIYLRTD